jgi:hypothetical protein
VTGASFIFPYLRSVPVTTVSTLCDPASRRRGAWAGRGHRLGTIDQRLLHEPQQRGVLFIGEINVPCPDTGLPRFRGQASSRKSGGGLPWCCYSRLAVRMRLMRELCYRLSETRSL